MGSARRGVVVIGLMLAVPRGAFAQSDAARAAARDLGAEGVEAFQAGDFPTASAKLSQAFDILKVPSLGLWSARALVKEGKLVEASERYLSVSRLDASKGEAKVQRQAQADAAKERDALQPRIAGLTLGVKGGSSNATVTLDDAPVAAALFGVRQPANPGKHRLEARDNDRVVQREISLTEGQRLDVVLDFGDAVTVPGAKPAAPAAPAPTTAPTAPPPPAASSSGVPAGVWVGVAITGAGLLTGGVGAVLAAKKKDSLGCPADQCKASQRGDVDVYNQLRTVSTIGFVVAGVGAVTTGVFWFTRPREPERAARITPWLGVGSAGVRGIF
jgi:hypothetical protein